MSEDAVVRRYPTNGWSCAGVAKLKSGHIRKRYDTSDPVHAERFAREVSLLTRLAGCSFVPQLVRVDQARGELLMTDCGTSLESLPLWERRRYERRLPALLREMHQKYGVMRMSHNQLKQKFDVPARNATVKNGQVFIIDLNGARWRVVDPPLGTTPLPAAMPTQSTVQPLTVTTPTQSPAQPPNADVASSLNTQTAPRT